MGDKTTLITVCIVVRREPFPINSQKAYNRHLQDAVVVCGLAIHNELII